ncbi:hypothetical protein BESB_067340 [Besnoitia besnoiti]|uniref:Uncharacterized protein n=1 Tax=Besnoitia besnoiti TaxID=94643 RepID=A0A2A9MEK9_BESBE|nr:hypothetical protein BESB_067340 [Besnoitia besnoiti]PFH34701.1 hypothetical protein BESB_067340 [Besnoitia besnoiti]
MSLVAAVSAPAASSAKAFSHFSPLRCRGPLGVGSLDRFALKDSLPVSAGGCGGAPARAEGPSLPVCGTAYDENDAFFNASLVRPFFPAQLFPRSSKRRHACTTGSWQDAKKSATDSPAPPLKKARSGAAVSASPGRVAATSRPPSAKALPATVSDTLRAGRQCLGDRASNAKIHAENLVAPRSEEAQSAASENKMKAWVLGVAAAVWEVRGSRMAEAYERELMAVHDQPVSRPTTSQPEEPRTRNDGEFAALQGEIRRLEKRLEEVAQMQRESLTEVQQAHVRNLQRLRSSLLGRQQEMRDILQQLSQQQCQRRMLGEKGRHACPDLMERLRHLMDEQERRVTLLYVQQVNNLQDALRKSLTRTSAHAKDFSPCSEKGSPVSPGGDDAAAARREHADAHRWRALCCADSVMSEKRVKKKPPPFSNSNSSLKRRSVCMLRGLASAARSETIPKKAEASRKKPGHLPLYRAKQKI